MVIAIALTSLAFGGPAQQKTAVNNPPNPAAVAVHSVTLKWQPSMGAESYHIYRSTTSKSNYQRIATSVSPSYKDTPVPSGVTFYYVVTAVRDKGESAPSNEAKAEVP